MTEELWKNSAIIAKRNVDSNQTPISVNLTELKQIIDVHSCLVLNQLPDEHYGIDIDGFTEVYDIEDVTTRSYKVDYANGVLYFHPNNIGKMLQVNYYGVGCTLLSASRIYTKYDKYGNVLETLEELLDKGKLYIQSIDALGGAVEVINRVENANATGTVLHENLLEDIEIGSELNKDLINNNHIAENTITTLIQKTETGNQTINNLTDKTNLANQKKQELEVTTSNANNKNTELNNTISTANNTDSKLRDTILSGKDSIDKINATGNKSLIIGASQFVNNEYTWTHNMNSKELNVVMYDSILDELLFPDCKIIDKNNILIRNSAEHPNIKVVLSASYYQGNALFVTNVEEFAGDSIVAGTKKVRLKDGNGVVENPITDSDAVFMPDGTTKLTDKIISVDLRLTEVATKGELSTIDSKKVDNITFNNIINKKADDITVRKISQPITLADLSTDVKQAITGGSVAVVGVNSTGRENIKNRNIDDRKLVDSEPVKNLFNKNTVTIGGYIRPTTGEFVVGELPAGTLQSASDYIPVIPNEKYCSSHSSYYAFYDSNYSYISGGQTITNPITVPSNASFFRVSVRQERLDIYQFEKGENISDYDRYYYKLNNLKVPKENIIGDVEIGYWNNKTFNIIGDSITYGLLDSSGTVVAKRFSTIISERFGMSCNNYGITSSTIAINPNDSSRSPIVGRYEQMANNADLIIVAGGTNDWYYSWSPIGDMNNRENTTFYGALHNLCLGLIQKYPKKQLLFMTPIKRGDNVNKINNHNKTLKDYCNIIKEVCDYYSIPVLDMYSECLLNPHILLQAQLYFDNVKTHPNADGHFLMANRLCGYIKQLC